ncbi:hypothetical protein CIK06_23460 [Plantactinospora sp. KBS50]|nr:hypothetical protein CIK06_23460 [Plantactinospora sp. KBS50]
MSVDYANMTTMDISVQRSDVQDAPFDPSLWAHGFQLGSSGGMARDLCARLVRQDLGSARHHLAWHERIERTAL